MSLPLQHPAIESAINAMEVHGLNKCPVHGIHRFKRNVAFAMLAGNICQLGNILQKQKKEQLKLKRGLQFLLTSFAPAMYTTIQLTKHFGSHTVFDEFRDGH